MQGPCPICETSADVDSQSLSQRGVCLVHCPSCREYGITEEAAEDLPGEVRRDPGLRDRLARYLWETRGQENRLISSLPLRKGHDWPGPVLDFHAATALYQEDGPPLRKYEDTVLRLAARTGKLGEDFDSKSDRWVVPTMDDGEALAILRALAEDGYLALEKPHLNVPSGLSLTTKGLRYAAELARAGRTEGNAVFVAACFSREMRAAQDAIVQVLRDLGYDPLLVDRLPHNDLVDLQIYEGIRQSRFMVADLTWNRQSVYYEVGFAHGLGLEVTLTCRCDCFKHGQAAGPCKLPACNGRPCDFTRVHFDLEHRNILLWDNEKELGEKLRQHLYQSPGPYRDGT